MLDKGELCTGPCHLTYPSAAILPDLVRALYGANGSIQ